MNIYVPRRESINGSLHIKGLVCGTRMVSTVATLPTITAVAVTFKVVQSSLQVLVVWAHQRASWSAIVCLITRAQLVQFFVLSVFTRPATIVKANLKDNEMGPSKME